MGMHEVPCETADACLSRVLAAHVVSLSGKPDAMLVLNHENRSIRQRRGLR